MAPTPPASRDNFRLAIVCALRVEFDAVTCLLDHHWDANGDRYGAARGDPNAYTTGRIGQHDVVLLCLADAGKVSAGTAMASMNPSFPCLKLVLLVGICGGMPRAGTDREILLGDVIFAQSIVQYDLGRLYADGLETKHNMDESLGRAPKQVRNLFEILQTRVNLEALESNTNDFLHKIQGTRDGLLYQYPGIEKDKLFPSDYQHKHYSGAICTLCQSSVAGCKESRERRCAALGCDERRLIERRRLKAITTDSSAKPPSPRLIFGRIGSGDVVVKSGVDRDAIATKHNLDALEMEGAGLWEELPCIIVKAVCDYADSHKNKEWQHYAAATAASAAIALAYRLPHKDWSQLGPTSHFIVPFGRSDGFVGRQSDIDMLVERTPPDKDHDSCQRTVIQGLGGIGKTQLALEAAYRIRTAYPECSIFWVPAINVETFENAYREIGRCLGAAGVEDDSADIKTLVQSALSQSNHDWLLIIDNADDATTCYPRGSRGLFDYLPSSHRGSILVTTRNQDVAVRFQQKHILRLGRMSFDEATDLLLQGLELQQRDDKAIRDLLEFLDYLPLAIRQASAYMARTGMTFAKYIGHCRDGDKRFIKLLSEDFEDLGRYERSTNPVAVTWLISFEEIERANAAAAEYLQFISFLAERDIPRWLLPRLDDELIEDEAIGVLQAYAFVTLRDDESLDIHRLVQLAMRNWLDTRQKLRYWITEVVQRLSEKIPYPKHHNKDIWMRCLPHMQACLRYQWGCTNLQALAELLFITADCNNELAKYSDAEKMYMVALALREKVLGKENPSTLDSMNNLGLVLESQGKYDEAEAIHREALALYEKVLGKENPSTLDSMDNLGLVLKSQGKYDEAEAMHRQALALREKVLGKENPSTLYSMNNLGLVLKSQGKYDEAEAIYREALALKEKVLGKENPSTLKSMDNLALLLESQGRHEEAEKIRQDGLASREKVSQKEKSDTLSMKITPAVPIRNLKTQSSGLLSTTSTIPPTKPPRKTRQRLKSFFSHITKKRQSQ